MGSKVSALKMENLPESTQESTCKKSIGSTSRQNSCRLLKNKTPAKGMLKIDLESGEEEIILLTDNVGQGISFAAI